MEKESNNISSGIGILLVVLFVAILSLGGYIVYDKLIKDDDTNLCQNNPVDNCKEQEEIIDIVGYYETEKFTDGEEYTYKLVLLSDNTYIEYLYMNGKIGTYSYDGKDIVLHQKWSFGTDPTMNILSGIEKVSLDSNNNLIKNNINYYKTENPGNEIQESVKSKFDEINKRIANFKEQ